MMEENRRGGKKKKKRNSSKPFCGFTIIQFEELQLQALIFNYISSGLPVPRHLLIPIVQSFSRSFLFPTISRLCGISEVKRDEEEPLRCRRTDGKKWRCCKEALKHHKYCHSHLHRERQRSKELICCPNPTTNSTSNGNHNSGGGVTSTTSNNVGS